MCYDMCAQKPQHHHSHLEGLLKCRTLGSTPEFLIQWVWGRVTELSFKNVSGNADAASL